MNEDLVKHTSFHLTGMISGDTLERIGEGSVRSALHAGYHDLTALRYDFPLVLVRDDASADPSGDAVQSLSRILDGVLTEAAPKGGGGESLRDQVLQIEREIRAAVAQGATGTLSQLWDQASEALGRRAADGSRETLKDHLLRARDALRVDGKVVDCNADMPAGLLRHAWARDHQQRATAARTQIDQLILRLHDILKADFMQSDEAVTAESLRGFVGSGYEDAFDFESMSRILAQRSPGKALPEDRRRRVRSALAVLDAQKFFAPAKPHGQNGRPVEPYDFVFVRCTKAVKAYRERLPELVKLVKAISIAELEAGNQYNPPKHDAFFDAFDAGTLMPDDIASFPTYLVLLRGKAPAAAEQATIMDVLASDLPMKVLLQTDDLLGPSSIGEDSGSFSTGVVQTARMALGLNTAFVLQTAASNLFQMRDQIARALTCPGPALFSVFSGCTARDSEVPPYLVAASALESRVFPTFSYDPSAGSDWASRFVVNDNPQAQLDWPVHDFRYEDHELQRGSAEIVFTVVDFLAADGRFAAHFARVSRSRWHDGMIPVGDYLDLAPEEAAGVVPYIWVVDQEHSLHRFIVDAALIRAARRCRDAWRSLQELGGIHNSHARNLLDSQRALWEEEKERELQALRDQPPAETNLREGSPTAAAKPAVAAHAASPVAPPAATAAPPAEDPQTPDADALPMSSDDPYIETTRCTTCHECIKLNDRMFAYDDNMQAYLVDPGAGSYQDLVEAAESCQVSIIHPGIPGNSSAAGLDEYIKRAEPFNTPVPARNK